MGFFLHLLPLETHTPPPPPPPPLPPLPQFTVRDVGHFLFNRVILPYFREEFKKLTWEEVDLVSQSVDSNLAGMLRALDKKTRYGLASKHLLCVAVVLGAQGFLCLRASDKHDADARAFPFFSRLCFDSSYFCPKISGCPLALAFSGALLLEPFLPDQSELFCCKFSGWSLMFAFFLWPFYSSLFSRSNLRYFASATPAGLFSLGFSLLGLIT